MNKEQFLLLKIIEECTEVSHVASKTMQFGKDCYNPNDPDKVSNIENLKKELWDLLSVIDMYQQYISDFSLLDLDSSDFQLHNNKKMDKINYYSQFSKDMGKLKDE